MTRFATLLLTTGFGSAAWAHPGAHLHPHDGVNWLALVSALAVIALATGLALAGSRK